MAFILNTVGKAGNATTGNSGILYRLLTASVFRTSGTMHFMSNTINYSMASAVTVVGGTTTGRLASVSLSSPSAISLINNSLVFTNGTILISPTATGTLGWVFFSDSSSRIIITDSVSTMSGSGIVKLPSLSLTNGVSSLVTMSFSLN